MQNYFYYDCIDYDADSAPKINECSDSYSIVLGVEDAQ